MCNPRRVTVHLHRAVSESWRTMIERAARAEGQVQELARLNLDIPLRNELGDLALEVLERLLRGDFAEWPAWQRGDDGQYRHDLGGVTLIYQPGSRQFTAEARLTELISAEARASAEVSGFTVGEVAVEAASEYYDDNWGGRTEEWARTQAEAEGRRQLAHAVDRLHHEQHRSEIDAARQQADLQARQLADQELDSQRKQVREVLRDRLRHVLDESRERIQHSVNRLVGETYRRTLIHLIEQNGGRIVRDERSGSVMNLELELF